MQLVVIYAQVKFTFHIIGNLAAYVNIECVISCILVGGSIMKFAEKVRAARLNIGYTQKQLAEITHVALRTIVSYEKGESYPRKRETYAALANALDVETNYLLTEDEEFVVNAAERYGTRGAAQAQAVIEGFSGLCAGGALSEEDKDAVMKALQDIYWESKARNVQKYTPKKFKKS